MGAPKGYRRYNKEDIYQQAITAIQEHKLVFIGDIYAFVACQKTKFSELFPTDSPEMAEFRDLMDINKIQLKSGIRAKLFRSEKAAELLALYRLICTPEEHRLLNQQYLDHTTDKKPINVTIVEHKD